jgi:hypothetical protein
MAEPLAIGSNYDDLVRAFRERAAALGMTDKIIEEIGGFTGGHVGKLLGAKRTKSLGGLSFGMMLGALGLKFAIIEDEEATARIRSRFDPSVKSRRVPMAMSIDISPDLLRAIYADHFKRIAPLAAEARRTKISPHRRVQIAKKAARARWRKRKPSMGTF